MDACQKIYFTTPAQAAGYIAGILGMAAGMLALIIIC